MFGKVHSSNKNDNCYRGLNEHEPVNAVAKFHYQRQHERSRKGQLKRKGLLQS
uniref:Uncharacterized protein n=1 Tax=Proteus vulgaris TaxID=585 RepID=Q8KJT5_PROVU|nr:hypothetical protein [Proteus vulgaris]